MAALSPQDATLARMISELAYCNPFLPERQELEKQVLGSSYTRRRAVIGNPAELDERDPNRDRICELATGLIHTMRDHLAQGGTLEPEELQRFEDLSYWVLYHRYRARITALVKRGLADDEAAHRFEEWPAFLRDAEELFNGSTATHRTARELAHVLAVFFQIRRAFHHIFSHLVGASDAMVKLRAAIWQSIFTHDLRRYQRGLFNRMGDYATLIVGPSGTGKELVARAIGLSRYIPFDLHKRSFTENFAGSFAALNLSAMSPTLIESELFGHKRGAFTGALADRAGWLEVCPPLGAVFLDEIGELDAAIQVKLLRVLQSRRFQRIGETRERQFAGKIIAATNRNLAQAMRDGVFREDFYYRLCSDIITTPSLREQLADRPDDLYNLALFIAERVAPQDARTLADEVQAWVSRHLGKDYAWPGNVRELEQCVVNILIRRAYHPAVVQDAASEDCRQSLARRISEASLTADEMLTCYCTLVYAKTGNYVAAARQLGLDRRTVRARIDPTLLAQLTR